jgi:hypothetical protein
MKILCTILIFVSATSAMAQMLTDFSGNWIGTCQVNTVTKPSQKSILQLEDKSIEINGMIFDLTKPTTTTLDDTDQGNLYREITVYDWQWDEAKQTINTSARWLGWYLHIPGSWSGEGKGIIKIENDQLITTRKFGSVDEVCTYHRE